VLRGNKEVVLESVRQNGKGLESISAALKGNTKLVLDAVRRMALGFVMFLRN